MQKKISSAAQQLGNDCWLRSFFSRYSWPKWTNRPTLPSLKLCCVHTLVFKPAKKTMVYIIILEKVVETGMCWLYFSYWKGEKGMQKAIQPNTEISILKSSSGNLQVENVNMASVNASASRARKTGLVSVQWKKSRQSLNTRKQLGIIILP